MKRFICLTLALALGVNVAARKDDSPITRVVALLKDLQARIESDGQGEQSVYDKYACWCEQTTAKSAATITSVKDVLKMTGNTILRLKGKVATLSSEIQGLKEDIKKNLEQQAQITNIREKENAAFMAEKAEMEQALAAMEKAITILKAATGPSSFVQTSKWSSVMSDLVSKMSQASLSTKLSEKQISLLGELSGKKQASSYAPQSATIQGILSDMYTTFSNNLQTSTADEAKSYRNYEDLMATYQKQLATLQETLVKKEAEKTEVEIQLADATQTYADSEEQLKSEIKVFDATKASCVEKTAAWSKRSTLRKSELAGIKKALEILSSDEAKELFAKSIKPGFSKDSSKSASFVQIDLHSSSANGAQKAAEALEVRAKQTQSFRLASLAATIRSQDFGTFDKVITMIDKLLVQLQEEEAADIKKVDGCGKAIQETTLKQNDLDWKIENNKAKVSKHKTAIEQKTAAKEQTIKDIEAAEIQLKDMAKERKEGNDAYLAAKKDDEKAIDLLEQAKSALEEYFNSKEYKSLLQQEPEPDFRLSDKDSAKNQGAVITSILEVVITDLNGELAESKAAEEAAQLDYEKMKASVEEQKDKLNKKKINLEGQIAEEEAAQKDEEDLQKENEESLGTEKTTEADLRKTCDDAKRLQPERSRKRKLEADGLNQAKDFLAGMSSDALLQTPRQTSSKSTFPAFQALSFMQRRTML